MKTFMLRREPFGGVLATLDGETVVFLNESGFHITSGIADGLNDDQIIQTIQATFQTNDTRIVRSDVQRFRAMISNESQHYGSGCGVGVPITTTASSIIPTLSAPLELHWEVTGRCNLNCRHCYNRSGLFQSEPDLTQLRTVVSELQFTRLRGIIISGGEPLMRNDLQSIIELVRSLTLDLVLSTNGTLVTENNIQWIAELCDCVNVSLDGPDSRTYDEFRGQSGAFDKCLKGLRLLVKKGPPVVIQTTISRTNIDCLDEIGHLIMNEGAKVWIVRLPVYSGRAKDNESHFMKREEIVQKEPYLAEIRSKYQAKLEKITIGNSLMWTYEEPYASCVQGEGMITCAAGTILAALKPDGCLVPCALFGDTDFKSRPVWGGAFLEEWNNAECFQLMRRITSTQIPLCHSCSHLLRCTAGCRAKAYISGSLYSPDPDCGYVPETNGSARR